MKAADYLAKKSARKKHVRSVRRYGPRPFTAPGPRVEVSTPTTLMMSGTTDDIDTPEKRDSIARSILGHFVDIDAEIDRS